MRILCFGLPVVSGSMAVTSFFLGGSRRRGIIIPRRRYIFHPFLGVFRFISHGNNSAVGGYLKRITAVFISAEMHHGGICSVCLVVITIYDGVFLSVDGKYYMYVTIFVRP